jgi:hypothetical protein
MSDFLETINRAFEDLIKCGDISVESSYYDEAAFGNACVVLTGRGFRLRLKRDRSDVSADAGVVTEPAAWEPLQRVLQAVGIADAPPEGLVTPAQAAEMVRAYMRAIEDGFSAARIDQTRRNLEELGRQRLTEFFKRLHQVHGKPGA